MKFKITKDPLNPTLPFKLYVETRWGWQFQWSFATEEQAKTDAKRIAGCGPAEEDVEEFEI